MATKRSPHAAPSTQRNAQLTKERILSVAFKEFAARGYDGARVDAIVARCKISKNLIYHYFSSKEDLFLQVMERAYGAMRARQNELALSGNDPVAQMRTLVEKTIQHFVEQPEFIQLLATENLYKAAHIKKSSVIPAIFNPLRTALKQILEQGKAQGVFRQDADWVDLYVSISGLGSYAISNQYTLSYVLDVDLGTLERRARRMRHIPDMIMSYLCDLDDDKGALAAHE